MKDHQSSAWSSDWERCLGLTERQHCLNVSRGPLHICVYFADSRDLLTCEFSCKGKQHLPKYGVWPGLCQSLVALHYSGWSVVHLFSTILFLPELRIERESFFDPFFWYFLCLCVNPLFKSEQKSLWIARYMQYSALLSLRPADCVIWPYVPSGQ